MAFNHAAIAQDSATAPAKAPPPAAPNMRALMNAAAEQQRAAIAIQREAVQKQAATAGVWLPPWGAAAKLAEPPCDPIADPAVTPIIESAAKAHDLQPNLIRAVIEQESGFRPCAVSSTGAEGLMQLMPGTAGELGVSDPFDAAQNIDAGAKYLKDLIDKYKGDLAQALGAYNAGPDATDQAGGIPEIPETRDYVDAILKRLGK
jgi:soluble lytic murein transglycosylase-like protein